MAFAALSVAACGADAHEPCTRADLDRPVATETVAGVRIVATRRLNGDRLDPLPVSSSPC